jgi:hypothetical protein
VIVIDVPLDPPLDVVDAPDEDEDPDDDPDDVVEEEDDEDDPGSASPEPQETSNGRMTTRTRTITIRKTTSRLEASYRAFETSAVLPIIVRSRRALTLGANARARKGVATPSAPVTVPSTSLPMIRPAQTSEPSWSRRTARNARASPSRFNV